ncbi:MAG: hypothetical protein J5614_00340 [Paludibacteraceae bacterium]|nr:hypothetical protein [Paludibacteraceae bacterium]
MGMSYPTKPCEQMYDINPLYTYLADLKRICDQRAVQIEFTLKPTEIKFKIIKKHPDGRVKKSERTIPNAELVQSFTEQIFMSMVNDVCNPYV